MTGRKVIAAALMFMVAGVACAVTDERRKERKQADDKPVTHSQTKAAPQRKPLPKPARKPAVPVPAGLDSKSLGLGCSSGED